MPNDSEVVIPNVMAPNWFGGISDYVQTRHIASEDDGQQYGLKPDDEGNKAHIGARVGIQFLGGHIARPIITCFLQHPNQTDEMSDATSPKTVFQFNGVRAEIDETGQLQIIHKGAPKVNYSPKGVLPQIPGLDKLPGDDNPAIEPADSAEYSVLSFGDGGVVKIVDSDGQTIEINRLNGQIKISNNAASSLPTAVSEPMADDSESIILDRNSKTITVHGRNSLDFKSDDKVTKEVGGNETEDIKGSFEQKVGGGKTEDITDSWTVNVKTGAISMSASNAKLKLGSGKFGMSGPPGELVALIIKTLEQFSLTMDELVNPANQPIGNLGFPTTVSPGQTSAYSAKIKPQIELLKQTFEQLKGGT
jgi:hypothetical protein